MSSDSRSMTFDGQGLIPAVIQDWFDGTVLMVGHESGSPHEDAGDQISSFLECSRQKLGNQVDVGHFCE